MKRCLVTGGAGFVGIALVRRLVELGWRPSVLDVSELDAPDLEGHVEYVNADVRDPSAILEACRDKEVVFHLAAAVPLTRAGKEFWAINVGGTRNVLEAAQQQSVAQVVHLSTSAIYGAPHELPIDEQTPFTPMGQYGRAKLAAEDLCRESRRRGLNVAIIRPRTIIGEGRLGIFQILYDWIERGKPILIIGSGHNLFQLLSIRDLVQACVLAADKGVSDDFNIGAQEYSTLRNDLGALANYAGTGSRVTSLPSTLAKASLKLLDVLRLSPLVEWHYRTADMPFHFDNSKSQRVLGWEPQDSNIQMLTESYEWYRMHFKETEAKYGLTHRRAVRQKMLKVLRNIL